MLFLQTARHSPESCPTHNDEAKKSVRYFHCQDGVAYQKTRYKSCWILGFDAWALGCDGLWCAQSRSDAELYDGTRGHGLKWIPSCRNQTRANFGRSCEIREVIPGQFSYTLPFLARRAGFQQQLSNGWSYHSARTFFVWYVSISLCMRYLALWLMGDCDDKREKD